MNMKLPPLFQETDISALGHPLLPRCGVHKTFTPGHSDAGRIPPSIIVVPSLNVDSGEHDCANLSRRPAMATFVAQEVPRMIEIGRAHV